MCAVPFIFWYETVYVLPFFYDPSTFWYKFHYMCAMFVFFNIVVSYVFTLLCDTSIKGRLIKITEGTSLCLVCDSVQPPRSWHCSLCNTCILKRDHHCYFASTCIGFYNYRYFYTMLLFVTIGLLYFGYFHVFYTYHNLEYDLFMYIRIFVPFIIIFFDDLATQIIVAIFLIVGLGSGVCIAMSVFYFDLIRKGQVNIESRRKNTKYDLGFKENLRQVFGELWYVAWLSPIIPSKLPGDGINFKINETFKDI
ncbi:probable palmitoyltransferase ZDHHC24 [Chrysoperla carnea]|uniref:probable palmitoyltransferase ZDHHC24 n=1 Tax=Chrysoperla carnea TaxID=189513 RepID=UPI001D08031E|nr:probable palmitoyltransferase ZDHHC24 [Chrysoperla carnea]